MKVTMYDKDIKGIGFLYSSHLGQRVGTVESGVFYPSKWTRHIGLTPEQLRAIADFVEKEKNSGT